MSYHNASATGTDRARTLMDRVVLSIVEKMFEDLEKVLERNSPEQSVLAHLRVLDALYEELPASLAMFFGRSDFQKARDGFNQWYEKCQSKVPVKYRKELRESADREFARWERRFS